MLRKPPEMRFDEIAKVLEYFGWRLINVDGSHFHYEKYEKEGYSDLIVVQHNKKVKRGYITAIIKIENLEEWYEQTKEKRK